MSTNEGQTEEGLGEKDTDQLLPPKKIRSSTKISWTISLEYFIYLLVAFPTAMLNGLAAIAGDDPSKISNLQSPDDLRELLKNTDTPHLIYGGTALLASEAVLFFLNKRYLLASSRAALDLLRRDTLTVLCKADSRSSAGVIENILFFWSIATSLIFAEMGGKALSFLGSTGKATGFSLSLVVYFATRFASAKMFLNNARDNNSKLKKKYTRKLELLKSTGVEICTNIEINSLDYNKSVADFLQQIDTQWDTLPKSLKHVILIQYLAPILGYMAVLISIIPIMCGFMPEAVQGAELLTRQNITQNSHYQNPESFGFGIPATALTLFFYEINIIKLPEHLLRTGIIIQEKAASGFARTPLMLIGLTLLAFGSSYLAALGFKLVASLALANGYFSYFGDNISNTIPDGLLASVTGMLWSHLQDLANQAACPITPVDLSELTNVDISNINSLLKEPKIDISKLADHRNNPHLMKSYN